MIIHAGRYDDETHGHERICKGGRTSTVSATIAAIVTCEECRCLMCLALATPSERCPYCTVPIADGHTYNCPVTWARSCAICGDTTLAADLWPGDDGKLECRTCREEHPRSGRYSFAEAGQRGTRATSNGTTRGAL